MQAYESLARIDAAGSIEYVVTIVVERMSAKVPVFKRQKGAIGRWHDGSKTAIYIKQQQSY